MSRWSSWLPSNSWGSRGKVVPAPAPHVQMQALREQVMATLQDCRGPESDRLRLRVLRARSPHELWLARCDIYQLIAHDHCQGVAAQRINALLPAFDGWVPAGQLRPV